MFKFLRKRYEQHPMDVKVIRSKILQFVKENLQRLEGGEAAGIRAIELYISCAAEDQPFFEKAVYINEGDRFRNEEVQKIADDFAISLPAQAPMKIHFTPDIPAGTIVDEHLPVGLMIRTKNQPVAANSVTAYLHVLSGEAERPRYTLTSASGKVYIGRDEKVQTSQGFFRINSIAFLSKSTNEANKFISRQHAHIEWKADEGNFVVFADEGGIPPRNKVKVQTRDGSLVKLQTEHIGHPLKEGDQIMLGESAVLQFTLGDTASESPLS